MTPKAKPALAGAMLLAVLGLAGCAAGAAVPAVPAASPPQQVTAKSVGGASGTAPRVIVSPTPLPGGKAGSQQVMLSDRTLVISSVTRRQAKGQQSAVIDLNLAVRDTGKKAISNESGFYELMDPGGDTFGATSAGSGAFNGPIGSGASRGGILEFQVPASAAPALFLLYRPGSGADTVLTRL
jgi:hypothetical protein